MTKNDRTINYLRKHIPSFNCTPGCHDCCGPVTASSEEMARLPEKSEADHNAALEELSCPHLGTFSGANTNNKGCTVYEERPLICRLFGTTPKLACPNGQRPEKMIDTKIEQKIYHFNEETRQVLV